MIARGAVIAGGGCDVKEGTEHTDVKGAVM